ncbi:MAG: ATP phosphoribosyltransferase regulatory subunit [Oscillospiraceae bacterium]|nr:ATP phosphoribosyltransferase regulatory subunit [Oscillospiraceae bacterium]
MNIQGVPLGFYETAIYQLRSLYNRYGYSQYKMSKFEEYDLYARNKDFLISDSVITFTDLNGKLMALKPDVTLSIVKNSKDMQDSVQKLYYNENVYRVAKGSRSFREIMQVGLECLGDVDDYCICEVLTLAAESLHLVSSDSILSVSHLGLLLELLDGMGIPSGCRDAVLKAIGEKNAHELTRICVDAGVSESDVALLKKLVATKGTADCVLPMLTELLSGKVNAKTLQQLQSIGSVLAKTAAAERIRIDFSVVDDVHYYNGIVFKGFVAGLPTSVLSGGQYDKLMQKLHRKSSAIGFAVYMDALERLDTSVNTYDADILLLYDESAAMTSAMELSDAWRQQGSSVMVQKGMPENMRFRKIYQFSNGEVKEIENNA